MIMEQAKLARKSIEKRIAPLRNATLTMPPRGWIRAIRDALGMTTRQLAQRMGAVQSRVVALEKAEANGATTLKSLREAAEAMNCTFVYAIIPTKPLDELLRQRAAEKADAELAHRNHTMALENQAMTKTDLTDERARLIDELLAGSMRRLWEDE
jgi:predicted DNA-binding mobile mystery protein A